MLSLGADLEISRVLLPGAAYTKFSLFFFFCLLAYLKLKKG